jgi:hypothetical protein
VLQEWKLDLSGCGELADGAAKGRAFPQVRDEIIDAAEMLAQQGLFLHRAHGAALALAAGSTPARKCAGQFTLAALEDGRHAHSTVGRRNRGRLGHEVEVEELDELEFHLARGRP